MLSIQRNVCFNILTARWLFVVHARWMKFKQKKLNILLKNSTTLLHRQRHLWACPVKTSKLGHKFGRCHMRQSPDRDTLMLKRQEQENYGPARQKRCNLGPIKYAKSKKKVHKEQKHGSYGPARQKSPHQWTNKVHNQTLFSWDYQDVTIIMLWLS